MAANESIQAMLTAMESLSGPAISDAKSRTRARIVRVATELFIQRGYRATSVDEIAKQAGVAKGTVYLHFKNKNDLMYEAIVHEKSRLFEPFKTLLRTVHEPAARLRGYVELALLSVHDAPLTHRLVSGDREMFLVLEELPPERRAEIQSNQSTMLEPLLCGVGAYDSLPPEERQRRLSAFMGFLYSAGALMDERAFGGLSPEVYARSLAKMIVEGIGAP